MSQHIRIYSSSNFPLMLQYNVCLQVVLQCHDIETRCCNILVAMSLGFYTRYRDIVLDVATYWNVCLSISSLYWMSRHPLLYQYFLLLVVGFLLQLLAFHTLPTTYEFKGDLA